MGWTGERSQPINKKRRHKNDLAILYHYAEKLASDLENSIRTIILFFKKILIKTTKFYRSCPRM